MTPTSHLQTELPGRLGPVRRWCGTTGERDFARPPAAAQYAWFDFFMPDYDIDVHVDRDWNPDDDYLANRVAG
jgi:hypothetical protein